MTVHAPISVTSNDPVVAGRAVQAGVGVAANQAYRNMKVPVRN